MANTIRDRGNPDDNLFLHGLKIVETYNEPNGAGSEVIVEVFTGDQQKVAQLDFEINRIGTYGTAIDVEVVGKYRRKGVASWLYREVAKMYGLRRVNHSDVLSKDGIRFMRGRRNPGITWSRGDDAAGIVPDQQNIDYMGFTVWMTPQEFLDLNPPKGRYDESSLDYLGSGVTFSPPWVSAEWLNGRWKIRSHEGRHRSHLAKSWGVKSVPVDVFPRREMRARHLTNEMISAPFESDSRLDYIAVVLPTAKEGVVYE